MSNKASTAPITGPAAFLGRTVEDRITGFSGVVTGYVTYLTGCNQCCVAAKAVDGAFKDSVWIDEQRLKIMPVAVITLDNSRSTGFDKAPPSK